jgi:fructose-1,6-bisphosphatase/inositol monophosphatase family enzyme
MSLNNIIMQLELDLAREFEALGEEIKRRVATLQGLETVAIRQDGDTTHSFDSMAEDRIINILRRTGLNLTVMSEESPTLTVGSGNEFVAIVDPIDGSDMVARGYPLASTAFSLVDSSSNKPVLSRIYEIFTGVHYSASNGIARRNGMTVKPSAVKSLSGAFIVAYAAPCGRRELGLSRHLFESDAALFLNYGGPLDIAKVGTGQCDGVAETVKGFAPRDLVAGWHIATCAGAVSSMLDGSPLQVDVRENSRTKFLVAANEALLDEMLQAYAQSSHA